MQPREHCPCWGAPHGVILPSGPVCSLPVSLLQSPALPGSNLAQSLTKNSSHRAFRSTQRNDLPVSGAVFIRRTCTPAPTVLPHRFCAQALHRFPSTHYWAAQTCQSYLRILSLGPCFLKHSNITRSPSALSNLRTGPWGHLHFAGIGLASLDPLPAKWLTAPSPALRAATGPWLPPHPLLLCSFRCPFPTALATATALKGRHRYFKGKNTEEPLSSWPRKLWSGVVQGFGCLVEEKPETLE